MHGPAILIPILVPLGILLTIFGIVYLHRRERMAMIERGMDPRSYGPRSAPYQNLKWGLLLIGSGVGLFLAFLMDKNGDYPAVYFALIAICGGVGLFITYMIEKKENAGKAYSEE